MRTFKEIEVIRLLGIRGKLNAIIFLTVTAYI